MILISHNDKDALDDNRLVMLQGRNYGYLLHDWEKGTNGGVDTWQFCELIVFARLSEYSLGFSFSLLPY